MQKTRLANKMSIGELPSVVLVFTFVALIGGVSMIVLSEFKSDTTDSNATSFIANAQVGIGKIGAKLGLLGTITILAVVIAMVVAFFSLKGM